ncbi:IS1595 family transposase, partial [Salinarimonas rosea]|uniref:IS1595 family transposase n=1 Tax=Salinarimonas rosea TaxID=552063 RepID=UPI0012EBA8C7
RPPHPCRRGLRTPLTLLQGVVEIDETEMPLRRKDEPPAGGGGRSPIGKMFIAGAVELSPEGHARRIRLAPIPDFSAATLKPFVAAVAEPGARVVTDGWSGYIGLPDHVHDARTVGRMAAHVVLKWTHRVFSNLKRWALGTFHGCADSTCAAISTSTSSAGTDAATPPRRSTPCSASARASRRLPPATSSISASDRSPAGRTVASPGARRATAA